MGPGDCSDALYDCGGWQGLYGMWGKHGDPGPHERGGLFQLCVRREYRDGRYEGLQYPLVCGYGGEENCGRRWHNERAGDYRADEAAKDRGDARLRERRG